MCFTRIIAATITVAVTTPVVSEAMSKNYYIVQSHLTNRCEVVDIKPPSNGISVALAYESRALAEAALAEATKYEIPDCSLKGRP